MEYLDRNPVAALKKPAKVCRATCLTKEQWDQVFACYPLDDPFRDLLVVMTETGCRPQEMRVMEARHLDLAAMKVRFKDGEIPGKKYGRNVELTEDAAAVLRRLALAHPDGPLFRNADGNPWKHNALNSRFQRLKNSKKGKKLAFHVHGYVARHSWATDLIEAGASAGAVAAMAGHRDPTVVLKYYGKHIEERERHLRGLLEKSRERPKGKQDAS